MGPAFPSAKDNGLGVGDYKDSVIEQGPWRAPTIN